MPKYFELEIALQEVHPRVWRRLVLPASASFSQLHKAIQESFGWQDCHLWEFRLPTFRGRPIAGLHGGEEWGRPPPRAGQVKLSDYFWGLRATEWCEYVYDFGDEWVHDVKLIAARTEKEAFKRRLLDGEGVAPPEDCGGLTGFERVQHFFATGEDTVDNDPEGLRAWLGDWRPDGFTLAVAKLAFDR
jgi:hypothetical protein